MYIFVIVLALMEIHGPRSPQPIKYVIDMVPGSYSENEPLIPRPGENVQWSSQWEDVKKYLSAVSTMNDEVFVDIFGGGCTEIKNRAKKLISSGHFDLRKDQVASVSQKSSENPAIAIHMQSVTSMKKEPYWVMFVIDCETGEIIVVPSSRCECPAGLAGGCSHLRALYAILSKVKESSDSHSQDEIICCFPPPLSSMKGVHIPLDYAFLDADVEKELKTLKKIKQKQNAARKGLNDQFLLSIELEGDLDVDGDDDDDIDFHTDDSDDSDSDSDDSDSDDSGTDGFDLDEEELDTEDNDDDIIDTAVPERKISLIKLCKYTHHMAEEAKERATISGSNESHEYKLKQTSI